MQHSNDFIPVLVYGNIICQVFLMSCTFHLTQSISRSEKKKKNVHQLKLQMKQIIFAFCLFSFFLILRYSYYQPGKRPQWHLNSHTHTQTVCSKLHDCQIGCVRYKCHMSNINYQNITTVEKCFFLFSSLSQSAQKSSRKNSKIRGQISIESRGQPRRKKGIEKSEWSQHHHHQRERCC